MTGLGIPLRNYSFLWTLNAALIVVIQLFLNWFNEHVNGIQIIYQILFGLVMVAISFLILITAHTYALFMIAMIALTTGEATASPAIPALVNDLTPREIKGRYQGFVNSWGSVGRALGAIIRRSNHRLAQLSQFVHHCRSRCVCASRCAYRCLDPNSAAIGAISVIRIELLGTAALNSFIESSTLSDELNWQCTKRCLHHEPFRENKHH